LIIFRFHVDDAEAGIGRRSDRQGCESRPVGLVDAVIYANDGGGGELGRRFKSAAAAVRIVERDCALRSCLTWHLCVSDSAGRVVCAY
jgi:hypothetical protein